MTEVRWDVLANLGNNFVASYDAARKRAREDDELAALGEEAKIMAGGLGGGSAPTTPAPQGSAAPRPRAASGALATATGGGDIARYGGAIAGIESGGRYDAVGPTHARLGRALGKYQVMEANVGPWSREALGREVSADEFLASPEIQDTVFQHRFGGYVQKYGSPERAAAAWFSGSPDTASTKRDSLGTSVPAYVAKFRNNLTLAGAPNAADVPAPGAQPAQGFVPPKPEAPAVTPPMGQPTPAQAQPLPPRVADSARQIQEMLSHPNPFVKKRGVALAEKYLTGEKYGFQVIGDQLVRTNARDGTAEAVPGFRKPDAKPAAVQEYEYARQQGYQGTFAQFQTEQKKAGATTVSVDASQNKSVGTETGKAIVKRFEKLVEEGDQAQSDKLLVGQLRELGGKIGTGGAAAAQGWLAERGIKVGPNVGEIEAYNAIVDRLTPQQRVPGSGATSDFDAKMFKSALPRLINTPEGNALIMDTLDALNDYRLARAAIVERQQMGEIDEKQAIQELRQLPSPQKVFQERLKGALEGAAKFRVTGEPKDAKGAPAAPQAKGGAAPQFKDGQTATHPQTGEKVEFRGGKWVPVKVRPDA